MSDKDMDNKYHLTYESSSMTQRFFSFLFFYAFLGFLVWLSNGSTWWTFLFGTIALLAIAFRVKSTFDDAYHTFYTKVELIDFVNNLPDVSDSEQLSDSEK